MPRFLRSAVLLAIFCFIPLVAIAQDHDIEITDPIEPVNRGIFWFNDQLDIYFLEPVATGYKYVTPKFFRTGVNNFFGNLRYPSLLVSDVVQLKFGQAANHTGRFLINSTIGLLGLFDVAEKMGLEKHEEDFGTALGYNGVPPGPYLVLPLLGPTTLRDGVGQIVDVFLDPFYYLQYTEMHDRTANAIIFGSKALQAVNRRADLIEAITSAKESSVDYYLFVQGAYIQYRQNLIYDNLPPRSAGAGDDSYYNEIPIEGGDEEIPIEDEE